MLPLRHCDIATTDQTHWHLIQSLVRCGKRRAFVRMSHVHILKIIVHGHPVQYQTRTVLLLYWCMVAKQLPAVSSPVCDGGCLIALCCDRRAPTGSPVQTFDHAVQCRLAFVCFEKGKCRSIRHTAWCQILQPFWHHLRLQPPLQFCLCVAAPCLSRMSHIHILEVIVHGHPVHDQTGIAVLLYWCMVANQLPAVSGPVCDSGCLLPLCWCTPFVTHLAYSYIRDYRSR